MAQVYNPIVRTFCRLRAALMSSIDLPREVIRPDTPLELLVPVEHRREVWRQLHQQGVSVPRLEPSKVERIWNAVGVMKVTLSFAIWIQQWAALGLAVPLGIAAYGMSRRRALHLPLGLKTVGDLVLCLTSIREHDHSGYPWTKNEIAFRVRLIIAESLGRTLDKVQPEKSLAELGAG